MSKFSKAIKAFSVIIKKPYLLNLILEHESLQQKYVSEKYNLPNGLPTVDLTELFPKLTVEVSPYSFLDGSSLPTDLGLLKLLCIKNKVEDYFEIGTWRGESVAVVAGSAKNCVTLNLPDAELKKMGLPEEYINMHRFFSKDLANVKHLEGNSQNYDFSILNQKFDLIFIDGDHHSESIKTDTENAFKLLKNNKSIIVWHDYGIGTETVRFNVLKGILDGCPTDKISNLYHVSNTLCAIYLPEKVKAEMILPNTPPKKHFNIKIETVKV